MTTDVVNIKHIAHRADHGISIMRPGPWGNPFKIGVHGTRTEVIEKFANWFANSTDTQAEWMRAHVETLRGRKLRCCCKPLPCHGDVFIAWLAKGEHHES